MSGITEDDVRRLTAPTKDFLCPLSANVYGINFLSFVIRDVDTGGTVFEVHRDPNGTPPQYPPDFDYDSLRSISYEFPASVLRARAIGTTLLFRVGSQPVHNFLMIERHYLHDKLIKSYEFMFDFCIPNSTNEWEAIYDVPRLDDDEMEEMINNPYSSQSDSFYFVDGVLVMHNKVKYAYRRDDDDYGGDNGNGGYRNRDRYEDDSRYSEDEGRGGGRRRDDDSGSDDCI